MRLELHIENLTLHGVSPTERFRIAASVERELTRMIAERGIPGSIRTAVAINQIDAGVIDGAGPGSAPASPGIARALYQGLDRPNREGGS